MDDRTESSTVSSPRRKGGRSSGALPICWTKSQTHPGPPKEMPPGGKPVPLSPPAIPIRGRLSRPAPSKTTAREKPTASTFPPFWFSFPGTRPVLRPVQSKRAGPVRAAWLSRPGKRPRRRTGSLLSDGAFWVSREEVRAGQTALSSRKCS